ncbi:MAG: hypothetical protein ISR58_19265 [Anaerolineales bacterium]|nr:hypothetical protein [Chloroflexota bacterium]MBL6983323.1 hypothetical protein [Anaerolineales bacterium]
MINQILLYLAAFFTTLWGVAHLFPTKGVVAGFGGISEDNRNIITMEWIVEGVALIFIGVLVAVITMIDPLNYVSITVYRLSAGVLVILAIISLLTGFKVNFLPFKLCPLIFTLSAVLLWLGVYL